ncbi:hypothetical protein ONZ51_g772 [Trametes cubensis]|uniref:Uncharacterized protein n=1 Tax=Trametes cubensis TaxID=1111947 RepID=A0AAD7XIC1_9APHY|nr:hypothetical protein ONZ51_g772 [Trametes cubensis]
MDKVHLLFSTVLLLLNTVFVATESAFGEEMWVVNANYPGGQDAYLEAFASVWYQTFGTAASIVLNLFSDALLIYRCYVIWNDVRVVLFPAALYLGSFALGIAQLIASGIPHSDYFAGFAQKLGTAYTSTIIGLEIIVTSLICVRILYVARRRDRAGAQTVAYYTGGMAVTVESALPCTLLGIAYLITFSRGDEVSIFFLSIYVMSTMIILRIVSGRAWTRQTVETIMTATTTATEATSTLSHGLDHSGTTVTDEKCSADLDKKDAEAMGYYSPNAPEKV